MRFHRNLVAGVIEALDAIFNGGLYADKALESLLKKNRRWGSRDRGFVAETVYDIVRWKRLYSEIAGTGSPFKTADGYRLFTVWALLKGYPLPEWPELRGISARDRPRADAGRPSRAPPRRRDASRGSGR